MAESASFIADLIRARGMRVTSQRLLIYESMREEGRHFTAEQLLERLGSALPSLSLQTVYNTLQLFVDLGVVSQVLSLNGAARFEIRTESHGHVICGQCGDVADLEIATSFREALVAAEAQGFRPETVVVSVVGVCSNCDSEGGSATWQRN